MKWNAWALTHVDSILKIDWSAWSWWWWWWWRMLHICELWWGVIWWSAKRATFNHPFLGVVVGRDSPKLGQGWRSRQSRNPFQFLPGSVPQILPHFSSSPAQFPNFSPFCFWQLSLAPQTPWTCMTCCLIILSLTILQKKTTADTLRPNIKCHYWILKRQSCQQTII